MMQIPWIRSVQYAAVIPPSTPYIITITATNGTSTYSVLVPINSSPNKGMPTLPMAVKSMAP